MKRCPQCEFVYEDDQTLCDMDGSKLAFDSRPLPKLQVLTDAPPVLQSKSFWRGRFIPAIASLVLATVLGLVYFISTQRQPQTSRIPTAQSRESVTPQIAAVITEEQPMPDSAAGKNSDPKTDDRATPDKISNEVAATPAGTPKRDPHSYASAVRKKKPSNLNTPEPQPVKPASNEVKPKKQSKVGALLKKTGRLLKKPFKF